MSCFRHPPRFGLRPAIGQKAFTLVEVACAAFALVFAIGSSIIAMQSGFRSVDYARGLTLASQILQSEIESVRMRPAAGIESLVGADGEVTPQPRPGFTLTRTITRDNTLSPTVYDITFTIQWRTTDQVLHTRSTTTRYCEGGLNDFFATNPRRS